VQAYKKMEIYKLPKILIMHMKRFKIQGYYGSKINKTITFPINDFDLSSFVRAPGQGRQVYDLFAVSNHFGSMSFGHYTAFAKNKNTQHWFNFDDSSVSQIRGDVESTIVSGAAYVLFYERRD
jgi:ubiquitin carboxyl-terminal hydrolase 4/11/15